MSDAGAVAAPTHLGRLIQRRREARHVSRGRVLIDLGIPEDTLAAYERGRIRNVPLGRMLALARYLGISVAELEQAVEADSNGEPRR